MALYYLCDWAYSLGYVCYNYSKWSCGNYEWTWISVRSINSLSKNKIWIVGDDPNSGYADDVWNSSDGKNWSRVTDHLPWGPRSMQYNVVFEDKIWIMGGQTFPGWGTPVEEEFYNDIEIRVLSVHFINYVMLKRRIL